MLLRTTQTNDQIVSLFLRIGLAFALVYAAVDAFKEPVAWLSYVPNFVNHFMATGTMLDLVSVTQLVLALWLLIGKYIRPAVIITLFLLGGITLFNLNALYITFRDVGLFFAAAALLFVQEK
jgi:hypothetical protein